MSATVLEAPVGASVTPATYCYDAFDKQFVAERTAQFRDQVERRLAGLLTEEQFKPLRLMNGVYLQLHAYMLRVAIPYGTLSAVQLRRLADIAERFDKGYGHFTTRQNLQFNWPRLVEIPDILEQLAEVEMHAIQTSGNCIRNVTTDQWAGVAADEIMDPRPWCELLRQWSSLHPEFSFLPRKFKIAVTGSPVDRAAVATHDIGLRMKRDGEGRPGFEVLAGVQRTRQGFIYLTSHGLLRLGDAAVLRLTAANHSQPALTLGSVRVFAGGQAVPAGQVVTTVRDAALLPDGQPRAVGVLFPAAALRDQVAVEVCEAGAEPRCVRLDVR